MTSHVPDHGSDIAIEADRLTKLETAEAKRAASARLDRRFEIFEAVLLSIAAVLTAWAGFQAAKWSGVQANSYSEAGAIRVESTRRATVAGQQVVGDFIAFTEWLKAAQGEQQFGSDADTTEPYVPDPNTLSGLLYERLAEGPLRPALDAWIAMDPLENPDAPATPLDMPEYRLEAGEESGQLQAQAESAAAAARTANQRSDDYVLMTIMFATVLFFAGISSKMDTARARLALISAATAVLISAMVIVLLLPKEV